MYKIVATRTKLGPRYTQCRVLSKLKDAGEARAVVLENEADAKKYNISINFSDSRPQDKELKNIAAVLKTAMNLYDKHKDSM